MINVNVSYKMAANSLIDPATKQFYPDLVPGGGGGGGTLTGITAGAGLIVTNAAPVPQINLAFTATVGEIMLGTGVNTGAPLAPGANGDVLTIVGGVPVYAPVGQSPYTAAGQIQYAGAAPALADTNLNIGTAGQVLTVNAGATAPEWAANVSSVTANTGLNIDNTVVGAPKVEISFLHNGDLMVGTGVNTGTVLALPQADGLVLTSVPFTENPLGMDWKSGGISGGPIIYRSSAGSLSIDPPKSASQTMISVAEIASEEQWITMPTDAPDTNKTGVLFPFTSSTGVVYTFEMDVCSDPNGSGNAYPCVKVVFNYDQTTGFGQISLYSTNPANPSHDRAVYGIFEEGGFVYVYGEFDSFALYQSPGLPGAAPAGTQASGIVKFAGTAASASAVNDATNNWNGVGKTGGMAIIYAMTKITVPILGDQYVMGGDFDGYCTTGSLYSSTGGLGNIAALVFGAVGNPNPTYDAIANITGSGTTANAPVYTIVQIPTSPISLAFGGEFTAVNGIDPATNFALWAGGFTNYNATLDGAVRYMTMDAANTSLIMVGDFSDIVTIGNITDATEVGATIPGLSATAFNDPARQSACVAQLFNLPTSPSPLVAFNVVILQDTDASKGVRSYRSLAATPGTFVENPAPIGLVGSLQNGCIVAYGSVPTPPGVTPPNPNPSLYAITNTLDVGAYSTLNYLQQSPGTTQQVFTLTSGKFKYNAATLYSSCTLTDNTSQYWVASLDNVNPNVYDWMAIGTTAPGLILTP
jgi:hypothetical protein